MGNTPRLKEMTEIAVPFNVSAMLEDVFEGFRRTAVSGNAGADSATGILKKFVVENSVFPCGDEALRKDEHQNFRKPSEKRAVLVLREKFENPIKSFDGAIGVQSRNHDVPRQTAPR